MRWTAGSLPGLLVAVACGAPSTVHAQDPPQPQPARRSLETELEALEMKLGEATEIAARRAALTQFVDAHADSDDVAVLRMRLRLAFILLGELRFRDARQHFDVVDRIAPATARDLHGAALYGMAQAEQLLGNEDDARGHLNVLTRRFEGTRYARFAAVALNRLDQGEPVRAGRVAPALGSRLDLDGKSRSLTALRGGPVLLVFWQPTDPVGTATVTELVDAAERGGLETDRVLVHCLASDVDLVRQQVETLGWQVPVLVDTERFLDDAALAYGVTRAPSWFLLDIDRTLLARDLAPRRLEHLLARRR